MRKLLALAMSFMLCLLPMVASAAGVNVEVEGVRVGQGATLNFTGDVNASLGNRKVTINVPRTSNATSIQLTTGDFFLSPTQAGGGERVLSTSTLPALQLDNGITSIVWVDGNTTPVQVTFRVPANYSTGGSFRGLFDDSSSATAFNQVDFSVLVNTTATAWDLTSTNQTPVALTVPAGSAEQVALSVTTDFGSLAAGQWVTVNVWRDNVAAGTADLEMYWLDFIYNASQ